MHTCFIAVHAGAGFHGLSKENSYKVALQQAMQAAMVCLDQGGSSLEAVRSAICVLEVKKPEQGILALYIRTSNALITVAHGIFPNVPF